MKQKINKLLLLLFLFAQIHTAAAEQSLEGCPDPIESSETQTKGCCNCITKLNLSCLNVSGSLVVNGINFSSIGALAAAIAANPAATLTLAEALAASPTAAEIIAAAVAAAAAAGVGNGYGYVYNLTQQVVPLETAVTFSTNGPLLGVTHTAGSDTIGIVAAGTYAVTFSVSGTEPNQFTLFVNGVANTSTTYGSGAGTQQNNGQTILTLGAGDVLTLVNHTSAAAVTLEANTPIGGTAAAINASILIQRLA